ncbi:3-dehydrosphinganine reductase [Sparganum proliferum]
MSGKAKSPDPQPPPSTICCETSVFRFPTPTHISNSSSSPKNQIPPSTFQLGSRPDACGTLLAHNDTIAPGTNGLLSVPVHPTLIGGANQALPGNMHKFETETNLGDIVRGPLCSVCNCRILLRSQHCIYSNLKTHKQCVSNAYLIPCPGPSRLFRSLEGQRPVVNCGRVNNPAGITPLLSAGNLPMGSDSNSASSCTSCSTPGSPFPLDAGRQALPAGPGLVATRSPTCVYSQSGIIDLAYNSAAVGDERICPTGLPQHAFVAPASGPNSPSPAHNAGQAMDPTACPTPGDDHHRLSTVSSCESSRTPVEDRLSRLESTESQDDYPVFMRNNSLSVSLRDWNIPMSALQLGEMIGRGTFGTVYRGKWHGEVAVKIIDFDPEDPDSRFSVDAFKREVVTLLKTRHENLVLFMGACMKPPNLAIVTQLSKGETLHHLLHFQKQTLSANRAIAIASQIAKGMGYLHARQIVHRDLKTRNIFIELNFKPVIADFGLFNFVKFCKIAKSGSYVHVPPNWLCYVAPETIRALNIGCVDSEAASDLPFTPESDVFAFGTVWYELLTSEYPFKGLPTETLLYLVGNGVKPALQIPCPKDFKEILVQCWSFHPHRRPEFTNLVRLLDCLPKLHRSPSYPTKRPSLANPISHDPLLV